ncbi:MAG: hypothetical protein WCK57_00700 [Verrucomicrobiae bacterium]
MSETAEKTLTLWRESWEKNGWEPVVLNENDAGRHPLYGEFSRAVQAFPSVNGPGFDYHAFMRWLASAQIVSETGWGIVTTEPDVINYSMDPESLRSLGIPSGKCLFLSPVPAMVLGDGFERFCQAVIAHTLQPEDSFDGNPHLSDQDFAFRYGAGVVEFLGENRYCAEAFQGDRWKTSPCVHYATAYMIENKCLPKHEHIPLLR